MNQDSVRSALSAAFHHAESIVIFGGTGFIGTHLTQYLLQINPTVRVVLYDLLPPRHAEYTRILDKGLEDKRVIFVKGDVRQPILLTECTKADIVFNLAAVHREPGHEPSEYYETNLPGAENVCAYAEQVGCSHIVFTSSISPYGPSEDEKTEESVPQPETAYGKSKLAAEQINIAWQSKQKDRYLLIMRPGVVFGPGEDGNVTRLIRSLVRGYFVYTGNRSTRKAGGYVKELCRAIDFSTGVQEQQHSHVLVVNFSLSPTPSLKDFVEAINKVGKLNRRPVSVPRSLLVGMAHLVDGVAKPLRIAHPVSPVRVRKLFRSTNVRPAFLEKNNYEFRYTLEEMFADWRRDSPRDFEKTLRST